MITPLSGTQVDLESGAYTATVASVGASLRVLRHRGRDLVVPFEADEVRPAYRGATLAPWPNRIVDGIYTVSGEKQILPHSEPERGHALHGLAVWLDFDVVERETHRVILGATVQAQRGYPFRLALQVEFRLDGTGLHSSVTATNTGTKAAPFGAGPHPYLVAGDGKVDDWTLLLPADRVLTVTDDRLIPVGLADVAGGVFDFRSPRIIDDTSIDHAFTGLRRGTDGSTEIRLTAASGTGVAMRWDSACPWVQVHTADQPDPAVDRIGLAVEPMTCPPDAFNSGTDLIVIEPGERVSAGWTITAL